MPLLQETLTIYAIVSASVHTFNGLKWLAGYLNKERHIIIGQHIEEEHSAPLRSCSEGNCVHLRAVQVTLLDES